MISLIDLYPSFVYPWYVCGGYVYRWFVWISCVGLYMLCWRVHMSCWEAFHMSVRLKC